ncbi:MAG: hypothetical protein JNM62_14580 [Flavobacteriales bacterium]|nr:hypothetical protein [Flavobacteriales bacterium]
MRTERIFIAGLVLVLSIVTSWALNLREQLNAYYSPFFDYELEGSRNLYLTKWKNTGKIYSYGYDRNEDLADDSLVIPADVGSAASIWVDEDHNGRFEVEYTLDGSGRCIAKYEDLGQDGITEEYIQFTPDSAFTYRDLNGDGRYAADELRTKRATR